MKLRELGISYLFQQNHGDKRNPDVSSGENKIFQTNDDST